MDQGHQAEEHQTQGRATSIFTIDVNAAIHSTLAPDGIPQLTPIALLKLEPTYVPGATVSATSFVAYSMTRGRIRVIGRESGARALLRLPGAFSTESSVQDMAICGKHLACVTSDGGLVVWDLPDDIEDDAQLKIILHVLPAVDPHQLKVVKWHPKRPDTFAVASERRIYLLQVDDAQTVFGAKAIRQDELSRISGVFPIHSPLVSFTFDATRNALASISIDSTITLSSIEDELPFWTGRVTGDGDPSSIDLLEGGFLIGRNRGNVFQLLPALSTSVLSVIQFVQGPGGSPEELSMFSHLSYDSTLKTLWVANSARRSLFAVKIGTAFLNTHPPQPPTNRPSFEQIVEFPCVHRPLNLTLVPAEGGEPGNTWIRDPSWALCAFSMHAEGVDQINIRQDAFNNALSSAPSKFPHAVHHSLPSHQTSSSSLQRPASSQPNSTHSLESLAACIAQIKEQQETILKQQEKILAQQDTMAQRLATTEHSLGSTRSDVALGQQAVTDIRTQLSAMTMARDEGSSVQFVDPKVLGLETATKKLELSFDKTQKYLTGVQAFLRSTQSQLIELDGRLPAVEFRTEQLAIELSESSGQTLTLSATQERLGERLEGLSSRVAVVEAKMKDLGGSMPLQLPDSDDPVVFPSRASNDPRLTSSLRQPTRDGIPQLPILDL